MADNARGKGRPSKFTPEIRKALIDAITAGLTYTHACQIVGIDYTTFNLWRNKGQEDTKGDYFDFFNALTRAETITSTSMMAQIRKASTEDWRAAAWWLEHRYPEEYGKQRIEHTGKDGGPVAMTFKVEWTDSTEGDNSGHSA